jgi:hypothetical protein
MADRVVASPSGSHGGKFARKPRIIVIHSVESEDVDGLVWSLATGWLQHEKVSVHGIAGPDEAIRMVPIDTIAWHCGNGNSISLGLEHTGRAAWTFDRWTEPHAFKALRNGARVVAEWSKALGIPLVWLSPDEVKAGKSGLASHDTMSKALGGSTHWDPGTGFPYAIYLKMCQQFAGDALVPDPTTPVPLTPTEGGAEIEEDSMNVQLVTIDGTIYVVDFGAGTKRGIRTADEYQFLINAGIKVMNGPQKPAYFADYRDITPGN